MAPESTAAPELRAHDLGPVGAGPVEQLDPILPAFGVCALIAAAFANVASRDALPISTTTAWAMALCVGATAPLVRRAHGEREALRWVLTGACVAPVIGGLAYTAVALALVDNSAPHLDGIPTSRVGLAVAAIVALCVVPSIASVLLRFVSAGAGRALRRLAWTAALAVGLVCSLAAHRAATAPASTDAAITGAEVARFCPAAQTCATRRPARLSDPSNPASGMMTVDELVARGVRIERSCRESTCSVVMARDDGRPLAEHTELTHVDEVWALSSVGEVVVRHNERHGFWLVETPAASVFNVRRRAFDASMRPTSLSVRDVASDHSTPRGWLYGAIAGVFFAAAVLLWPARRYRGPAPEACTEGWYDGKGTLFVDGVAVSPLDERGWVFAAGPVLWPRGEHAGDVPFRGGVPIRGVRAGTLAELRFAHAAPPIARSLYALAVLALTSAPLCAAALAGLVF